MLKFLNNGIILACVWTEWFWLKSDQTGSKWSKNYNSEKLALTDAEKHEREEKHKQDLSKRSKK